MLAQNALQMTQMGRLDPHGRQTISTPVGVFPLYGKSSQIYLKQFRQFLAKPDPRLFQQDQTSGYFYDPNGFYYDPKTGYYFNNATQVWCFWSTKYSTYIPVEGPETEIRAKLQKEERELYNQDGESNAEEVCFLEINLI